LRRLTLYLSVALVISGSAAIALRVYFHDFQLCQQAYFRDDTLNTIAYCRKPSVLNFYFNHQRALAHEYLGAGYSGLNQYELAIDEETKAISIEPGRWGAYDLRAIAYYRREQYDEAISDLKAAIALRPNDASNYHNLALAFERQWKLDAAIDAVSGAIRLTPKEPLEYEFRAGLYGQKGAYDLAVADYNRAIELHGADVIPYIGRALVYAAQHRFSRAIVDARQALRLRAEDPDAHSALCRYLDASKASGDAMGDCAMLTDKAYPRQVESKRDELLAQGAKELGQGHVEAAYKILRPLANEGNPEAQRDIGIMYQYGTGVPRDKTEAMRWYLRAAAQGDYLAQNWVSTMYYFGESGVARDRIEAMKWQRIMAIEGHGDGQYSLGVYYENGDGVPQNNVLAYMWYDLALRAHAESYDPAAEALDKLGKEMTEAEIEHAQYLAAKCRNSDYKDCGDTAAGQ